MIEVPQVRRTLEAHPLCVGYCLIAFLAGITLQGWLPF